MDPAVYRRNVLRDIETTLTGARAAADAIDCRTLAYFIEMALVELGAAAKDVDADK